MRSHGTSRCFTTQSSMEPGEIIADIPFKLFFAVFLFDAGLRIRSVSIEPNATLSRILSRFIGNALLQEFL